MKREFLHLIKWEEHFKQKKVENRAERKQNIKHIMIQFSIFLQPVILQVEFHKSIWAVP